MKLLVSTNNPAKRKEITDIVQEMVSDVTIVFPEEVGIYSEVEETGLTFSDNALLKARTNGDASQLITLADDGGIEIDAFNGEPGVKSRRWLGYEASDEELINYTITRIKTIPPDKRTARMTTCVCLYDPTTKKHVWSQASVEGSITPTPTKRPLEGFPFRALFQVAECGKYYDDLTVEEHARYNHRRIAIRKIAHIIASYAQH